MDIHGKPDLWVLVEGMRKMLTVQRGCVHKASKLWIAALVSEHEAAVGVERCFFLHLFFFFTFFPLSFGRASSLCFPSLHFSLFHCRVINSWELAGRKAEVEQMPATRKKSPCAPSHASQLLFLRASTSRHLHAGTIMPPFEGWLVGSVI